MTNRTSASMGQRSTMGFWHSLKSMPLHHTLVTKMIFKIDTNDLKISTKLEDPFSAFLLALNDSPQVHRKYK